MLTQYNLKMPHAVYGGENAMDNITAIIKARGAKKVAMFTDKGIEGAGLFALPEEAVKASGAEYYVLDELPPEPSYMAVQKLVDEFKTSGADLIVACGGGRPGRTWTRAALELAGCAGHESRCAARHRCAPCCVGVLRACVSCCRRALAAAGAGEGTWRSDDMGGMGDRISHPEGGRWCAGFLRRYRHDAADRAGCRDRRFVHFS